MTVEQLNSMVRKVASGRLPGGCSLLEDDGFVVRRAAESDHAEGGFVSWRRRSSDDASGTVLIRFQFPIYHLDARRTTTAAIEAIEAAAKRWASWEEAGARIPE
jgi:hypothetical protein